MSCHLLERGIISINAFITKAENSLGKSAFAFLTGLLVLLLASLLSTPRFITEYHGNGFTRLSLNPFILENQEDLRMRILSPLLGWLFYLRGPLFKHFMLFILSIFYSGIYVFCRKKNTTPLLSLLITLILGLSTLSYYQLYFPAYNDPLSYLLILLALYNIEKPLLSTVLLSLMLFNHENTLFLFPFFFLFMLPEEIKIKNILNAGGRLAIALIPYLVFRRYIENHSELEYGLGYYFDPKNMKWTKEHVLPHLTNGVFQAFKATWAVVLVYMFYAIRSKKGEDVILFFVLFLSVIMQFIIAHDISRLMGLFFPAILISILKLKEYMSEKSIVFLLISILFINAFIPSYYIGALDPIYYGPFWLK